MSVVGHKEAGSGGGESVLMKKSLPGPSADDDKEVTEDCKPKNTNEINIVHEKI